MRAYTVGDNRFLLRRRISAFVMEYLRSDDSVDPCVSRRSMSCRGKSSISLV